MTTMDDLPPNVELTDPENEQVIAKLIQLLEIRIPKKDLLQEDIYEKQNHFRNILMEVEHENVSLRCCNNEQKKMISLLEGRVCKLQDQIDNLLYKLNSSCDALRNMHQELEDRDRQLKQHAIDKQKMIQECNAKIQVKIDKMSEELRTKLYEQRELLMSYVKKRDEKLRLVKQILMSRKNASHNATLIAPTTSNSVMRIADRSISMNFDKKASVVTPIDSHDSKNPRGHVCQMLSSRERSNPDDIRGRTAEGSIPATSEETPSMTLMNSNAFKDPCSQVSFRANFDDIQERITKEPISISSKGKSMDSNPITEMAIEPIEPMTSVSPLMIPSDNTADVIKIKSEKKPKDKIPVVNPRYWRSQSADKWIDHRPAGMVPTGTILQIQTQPYKRTVRKLTNPKDFMTRSARYSLLSQEQDTDGELETKLYKADVLPTCGGGAQIVFKDIECLKQTSPVTTKRHDRQITLKTSPTHT